MREVPTFLKHRFSGLSRYEYVFILLPCHGSSNLPGLGSVSQVNNYPSGGNYILGHMLEIRLKIGVMLKKTVSAIGGIMLPSSIAVLMQRDSHWFSAHKGASYAVYGATV